MASHSVPADADGRTYTLDADFDQGVLFRVEHQTVHHQLQLGSEVATLPFIWVPNLEGTVSKVDTVTGKELARYRVVPDSLFDHGSPSRTTVDLEGNCWVGCRLAGTVVKIGLYEAGCWIDRNHDGVCQTSQDVNGDGKITGAEILDWGEDECVLYEVVLVEGHQGTYAPGAYQGPYDTYDIWGTAPRGLAVDASNNLWAGTWSTQKYYYIDGSTCQILKTVDVSSWDHQAYGAVIDKNGILWSSSLWHNHVLRLDPSTNPPTISKVDYTYMVYGLGLDYLGHLFVSHWNQHSLSRINITTGSKDWEQVHGEMSDSRGVACTSDNNVWVANSGNSTVTRYDNDGNLLQTIALPAGSVPTGVAVDAAGKVWVCDLGDDFIHRINPLTNTIDLSKEIVGSAGHYTYSDMTGIVSSTITAQIGTWTIVFDSLVANTPWGKVFWTSYEPPGASVAVTVRSSNDQMSWSPWESAGNGTSLGATPSGRYIQIKTTLKITSGTVSPILYDLTVVTARPVHVKWDSPGPTFDGKSWETAFHTVQEGLAAAMMGQEVWVAGDADHPYIEIITLKDRVELYGGFAGTETSRAQRNWAANVTVLDGNQAGSVVTSPQGATAATRIDGFTICNGIGTLVSGHLYGGGIYCYYSSPVICNNTINENIAHEQHTYSHAGGIYCDHSSAVISNNTITGNRAVGGLDKYGKYSPSRGGGIYCTGSSVTISDNAIGDNVADLGGGIYCAGGVTISCNAIGDNVASFSGGGVYCLNGPLTIAGNNIAGNTANGGGGNYSGQGGGIYCVTLLISSAMIVNNTITGNAANGTGSYASGLGGGVYFARGTITNNTIADNSASSDGGGIYCDYGGPALWNNIVAFNSSGICSYSGPTLHNNDVYANAAYDYSGMSAGAGDISANSELANLAAGDVHIRNTSPCRNAGDNSASGLPAVDMDGQARVEGSAVDIGADESYGEQYPILVIRVKPDSPYNGPGNDWEHAWHSVADGLTHVTEGDELWVAAGVYSECVTLTDDAAVYGGFVGDETSRDQRGPAAAPTVLDGGQLGPVVTAPPGAGGGALIDSFTIRNGTRGIYCNSSSPTITNNVVVWNGDGVYCDGEASPAITNNTIALNTRHGVCCLVASSPTITNNILTFNGTGIYGVASQAVASNNDVFGNRTDYLGIDPGVGDVCADPVFACSEFGDFHIQPDSSCRNAGTDAAPGLPSTDMDGQPRAQQGAVDIGADESDGTIWPPSRRIVYVSVEAPPEGDGTSWETAYNTIQAAIDDAANRGGAEIWVARGTYYEQVTLCPFAYLYGGFAGVETMRNERNPHDNVTVIDGGGGYTVTGASMSKVDGFTITGGYYGIYCDYYASPTISNNIITGTPVGISSCWYSSPTITGNTISNGDIGVYCVDGGSPLIMDNTITGVGNRAVYCMSADSPEVINNRITGSNGGICCGAGSPTVANNTVIGTFLGIVAEGGSPIITNNTVVQCGYGIQCYCPAVVTNNISVFNSTGIFAYGAEPQLSHNDVYGNTFADYDGVSPGDGDIQADPMLANMSTGDCHLTAGSPCINAGANDAPGLPPTEMDGDPRILEEVVDIGADEYRPPYEITTILAAKLAEDQSFVDIQAGIVSAAFPDFFYIEADDKSSGVRVSRAGHALEVGLRAHVAGQVKTSPDGERYIDAWQLARECGFGEVAPLGMINRGLGGADFFYSASIGAGQKGVKNEPDLYLSDLNNIGLLITTFGKVTYSTSGYFYIDDGSKCQDNSSYTGVKVLGTVPDPSPDGKFVKVTGASSCFKADAPSTDLYRQIRATQVVVVN